jgi:hypothetical protein
MTDRVTAWAVHTTALVSRIGEHGNAINACACGFAEHERTSSELLSGQTPASAGAGLLATVRIGAPAVVVPDAAGSTDANFLPLSTMTGVISE